MGVDPGTNAVLLLRSQRHSFLNHLQVISGWLQLQQPDRAAEYLAVLSARMVEESDVLRSVPPAAAELVISLALEAETYSVRVQWRVKGPVEAGTPESNAAYLTAVRSALLAISQLPEADRQLNVAIGPGSLVTVHMPSLEGEG